MRHAFRVAGPLLGALLAACSVLNRPDPSLPPERNCDGGGCRGVDPCDACDTAATCEAFEAGARCVCPATHMDVNGDGTQCALKGECSANLDCGSQGVCKTVDDAQVCLCRRGYVREDGRCVDIDECARGMDDCDDGARCTNEAGGFTCAGCREGFEAVHGDGRRCRDIDECENGSARCGDNTMCVNSEGAYGCICESGYEGNPRSGCDDIDECARGLLECGLPATCSNLPGAARCACPTYYSDLRGDGSICADDRPVFTLPVDASPSSVYIATPYAAEDSPLAVVMAGFFTGELNAFCGRELSASESYPDLFVAGLDGEHQCWVRSFGSPGPDQIEDVVFGRDGGPLLLLALDGDVTLDGATLLGPACMLLKLDAEGSFEWQLGLPGCDYPTGNGIPVRPAAPDQLDVDEAGNFYLQWTLSSAATIGELAVAAPLNGNRAGFVLKVSPSGEAIWAAVFSPEGVNPYTELTTLAVASDGRVYVSGHSAGPFVPPGSRPVSEPVWFLAEIDQDGVKRWMNLDEVGSSQIVDVAAHEGGVYALRSTDVSATVQVSLQSLDLKGEELWTVDLGEGEIEPLELVADRTGRLVAVGEIAEPASIGGEGATAAKQLFLTRIDPDGSIAWSHVFGPDEGVRPNGVSPNLWLEFGDIAFAPNDRFYVATQGLYIDVPVWTSLTAFRP